VKCRGRRRRRYWEEGEGRERQFHPKTYGWERQKHMVRKGFPVLPLLIPPVLQGEKEITKRDDDGVWTEKDRQGGRKTTNQMTKKNYDWENIH
jgi:hypothetical protein